MGVDSHFVNICTLTPFYGRNHPGGGDRDSPPPREECRENLVFRWLEADRLKAIDAEASVKYAQTIRVKIVHC